MPQWDGRGGQGSSPGQSRGPSDPQLSPGKRTLTEQLPVVQRSPAGGRPTVASSLESARIDAVAAASTDASPQIDEPVPGDNKPGFIDSDEGANIRNRPAELEGSKTLTDTPLPPATRVFVSGRHPQTAEWWYVTAALPNATVRGYVQDLRVTTDLPELTAKLYQVKPGDTAEGLAVKEFSSAVRDGHDLRFYENVLLFVNRKHDRAGVRGAYQNPGLLGGGSNNVQLEAGRRIWLVSPAYARALEGVVPDGSLTNGSVAKVKRFAGHVEDLLESIFDFPGHVPEVAGEYGQAIHDHAAAIIGITAGFLMAEAASMALAATPGGQIPAIIIQLGLAALGAHGMAIATDEALKHAGRWLELGWNANGRKENIAAASKELVQMLVSIAMAALSYMGVRGNIGKAVKIAQSIPPIGMVPVLASTGGVGPSAVAGEGVKLALPGPAGAVGAAAGMKMHTDKEGGGSDKSAKSAADEPAKLDEESFAAHAKPAERATAERISARPEFKGRSFRAPAPPDPGFDWIDDLGRTYDAMGDGTKVKYLKLADFKESIDHHLRKGNDFTVIDMTGFEPAQIAEVRAYVDTLANPTIIRVGF